MTTARQSLAGTAARGLVWAFVASAASRLSWLLAMAALARLLAPGDFGLFAVGLVYVAYVETVGDLGCGAALIYWPERTEEAAQVTFVANLMLGAGWFSLTQLVAPAVAGFFQAPAGEPVLRALAFSFLLKSLGNTHDALCRKRLRFRARLLPELALALTKAVVAVLLALSGWGVWSLVWGQLLGLGLWTAALWIVVPWRPQRRLPADLVAPMLRYGRGIVAVNALAAVVHHADLVVVGRMLGTTALGFYQVAAKVPETSITVAVWVVSGVLFPAFARLHDSGEPLGRAYVAALRYVSLLTVPAAVGLLLVAEPLVVVLFGEPWRPATPMLRALAVYAGIRSLGSHAGDVLKASGRSGLLAALALAKAAVLVPALIAAARVGTVRVAVALAAVTALTAALNLCVVARLTGVGLRPLFGALRTSVVASAVLAAAVVGWQWGGPQWGGPGWNGPGAGPFFDLLVQVGLGVAVYLAAVRLVDPGVLREARRSLRRGGAATDGAR